MTIKQHLNYMKFKIKSIYINQRTYLYALFYFNILFCFIPNLIVKIVKIIIVTSPSTFKKLYNFWDLSGLDYLTSAKCKHMLTYKRRWTIIY
jgi:hypothetical protein